MSHLKNLEKQEQQQQLEKQVKCVWQFHDKKDELRDVFDSFRFMTNEDFTEPYSMLQ